jgi:2-polyprenyl-3-methyl-5-hydroxy-6-metoxy-1,4-benzoquinol methylase
MTDERVIRAWQANAEPWTTAIREERIASRKLVTNKAIVDAVMSRGPKDIIDIGCGEGWLVRALAERGVRGLGVDVVPGLIESARAGGGGDFRVASYEDIVEGRLEARADLAVANFSLIGGKAVDDLIRYLPKLLHGGGSLVIQTLHPIFAIGDDPYRDGWLEGSWAGCGSGFGEAAPWYFRTLETWARLISGSGFILREIREPPHPETGKPASIIYIAGL